MTDETKFIKTQFRHDAHTLEQIGVIINYLETVAPGSGKTTSDAIRFAITSTAIRVSKETERAGE